MFYKNWIVLKDLQKGRQSDTLHFVVPIYQRVFAWGPKEVERLLRDLYCHFVINERTEEDYYLGVITVVRDDKGQMILVDGQQRVTCLMLLGAVLGLELDVYKLDYEARPKDRKALDRIYRENLVGSGDVSGFGNEAMDSFIRCVRTFMACLGNNEELDDDKNGVLIIDELKKVKETIAERLKLFVSILPDNPYCKNVVEQNRYFEKMNAGGRQLEPHEILKVRICSKISDKSIDPFDDWNRATDFSEEFDMNEPSECASDGRSETIDDVIFSQKEESDVGGEPFDDGEEALPTRSGLIELQMFLLHVLAICNGQFRLDASWSDEKLLDSFPVEDGISSAWATRFIVCMKNYRKFLDEKIIHLVFDTAQNSYDYRMNEDDDFDTKESNNDRKIRQFQAMMFVANRGKQGKQEWLLEAFKRWNDSQNDDPSQNLEMLKDIDLKLYATETRRASTYVDNLCYFDQSRWLFWRIDYLLWEYIIDVIDAAHTVADVEFASGSAIVDGWDGKIRGNELKVARSFRFHTGRSIEHLHPQTDNDDSSDWNSKVTLTEKKQVLKKDLFGNLCLLTQSLNSALSNDSVAVKLARITDLIKSGKAGLQSIKMLLMYKECGGVDSKWTTSAAQMHVNRLKEILKKSYLQAAPGGVPPCG